MAVPSPSRRVLIVDDESTIRASLGQAFELEGWEVHAFGDAESALEALPSLTCDVAIVDKVLPGMSGIEFARRLMDRGLVFPVLLATGTPTMESARELLTIRLAGHLMKPFEDTFEVVRKAAALVDRLERTSDVQRRREQSRGAQPAEAPGVPAPGPRTPPPAPAPPRMTPPGGVPPLSGPRTSPGGVPPLSGPRTSPVGVPPPGGPRTPAGGLTPLGGPRTSPVGVPPPGGPRTPPGGVPPPPLRTPSGSFPVVAPPPPRTPPPAPGARRPPLPSAVPEAKPPTHPPAAPGTTVATSPSSASFWQTAVADHDRRVLIVDDEAGVRDSLKVVFDSEGWTVLTCADGESALDAFARARYDLLLIDKNLPGIGGIDVVRRVREAGSPVPIVVMTAYATVESAVQVMPFQIDAYVTKPFDDVYEVAFRAKEIVDRYRRREEQRRSRAEQWRRREMQDADTPVGSALGAVAGRAPVPGVAPAFVVGNADAREAAWIAAALAEPPRSVETVGSTDALLRRAEGGGADVVLLDLGLDGNAVDTIRRLAAAASPPLVLVTGDRPALSTLPALIGAGAAGFIERPYGSAAVFRGRVALIVSPLRPSSPLR
ncbi:MAG TPA: response regulator [Myxococcota bacterium]|jgi:DNA-binding response OmpR family regulator|nr:response regulator [Myxococcota bacterium]